MATTNQDILNVSRLNAFKAMAPYLYPFLNKGLESDTGEFKFVDLKNLALSNTQLAGLELLTDCEYLDLTANPALRQAANISNLTKLKYFKAGTTSAIVPPVSQVIADVTNWTQLEYFFNYMGDDITGDFSHFTTLKEVTWTVPLANSQKPNGLVLPILGSNKSMGSYTLQSIGSTGSRTFDLTKIGTISDMLLLRTVSITNFTSTTATVDNILLQLRIGKQAGSALTSVNLTGAFMGIPTGGNSNSDRLTLVGLGVTVIVRTV